MEYTEGTETRLREPAREATHATNSERVASTCRHQGGITAAARGLLGGPRDPGNEATWAIVKAQFLEEDRIFVQVATAAARVASVAEPEEGSGPTWRPEGEFNPKMALDVVNSCNALSGARSDDLCFSQLQPTIRTQFGL